MALPTLDKTWIFKVNNQLQISDTTLCFKSVLLHLKQSLTDVGGWTDNTGAPVTNAHPWEVIASSNGTSAGLGDNWNTTADIYTDGTNFSWVVLRQPAVNPLYEISFGLSANVNYYVDYGYVAPNLGFDLTGLVTTAYPGNLGDRIVLVNNSSIFSTSAQDIVLHYMMSTDGECTYVFGFTGASIYYAPVCIFFWMFAKPKNPVSWWPTPSVSIMENVSPTYANFGAIELSSLFCAIGPGNFIMNLIPTTEGAISQPLGKSVNAPRQLTDFSWVITIVGLCSFYASTSRTIEPRCGELYDVWFCPVSFVNGETLPGSGTRQFVVFGNLLVPWNNSSVKIA
jgi:hypothetical protein